MTINVRMALLLLVPLAGFLCFCFVGLGARHAEIGELEKHRGYVDVVVSLIEVAHSFHQERSQPDSTTFAATNVAIEQFSLAMAVGPENDFWGLRAEFTDLVDSLAFLPVLRADRTGAGTEVYALYSQLVDKVVGPIRYLAYASTDVALMQAVDALVLSVALEDEIFREYDLGREIIAAGQLGATTLQAFNAAVTNQDNILLQLANYGIAPGGPDQVSLRERLIAETIRRTTWLDLTAQLARLQQGGAGSGDATRVLFQELRRLAPLAPTDLPAAPDQLIEIAAGFPLVDAATWRQANTTRLARLVPETASAVGAVQREIDARLFSARRAFWQYLALSGGAIVVCIFAMVILGRPLVRGTRRIASAMALMRESGDYSATVDVEGADEIAAIATSFNLLIQDRVAVEARENRLRSEMLAQEQQHSAELEARVAARTKELQQARQEAVTANEAKTRFLGNVSHHVRTPLNAILGFTQLLMRDPGLGEAQQHKLAFIKRGGEELLAMMDDVLQMVRAETGGVKLKAVPLDLGATLGDVMARFRQRAQDKGLGFELVLDPALPQVVALDGAALGRILQALLDNALKFTSSGEVRVSAATAGTGGLSILVQDSGVGMSELVARQMKGAFDQERVGCEATGGLGLGLSIAVRLTEAMGGVLSIESCPGRGTCVQVTFPTVTVSTSATTAIGANPAPVRAIARIA